MQTMPTTTAIRYSSGAPIADAGTHGTCDRTARTRAACLEHARGRPVQTLAERTHALTRLVGRSLLTCVLAASINVVADTALADEARSTNDEPDPAIDRLKRVAGIDADVRALSVELQHEIELELVSLPPERALSPAEHAGTMRAARDAFDAARISPLVESTLRTSLSEDDVAALLGAYESRFGRRLMALERRGKRGVDELVYTAFVDEFERLPRHRARHALAQASVERQRAGVGQAAMYSEIRIAMLVGMAEVFPDIDRSAIEREVARQRADEALLAARFDVVHVGWLGWLYRDLDDENFARAIAFHDSPSALRLRAALVEGFRKALVSAGLRYGERVAAETRRAHEPAGLAEI